MLLSNVHSVLLLLYCGIIVDSTHACDDGWFGDRCIFRCHCEGEAACEESSGQCPARCDANWFGPACQYRSIKYNAPHWLTDRDDTTCNSKTDSSDLNVTLSGAHYLTWIRVVLKEKEDYDTIQLRYRTPNSTQFRVTSFKRAKINETILDFYGIHYPPAIGLSFSGNRINQICSLYVSGGRNIALKQTDRVTQENSIWEPGNAVDGVTAKENNSQVYLRRACSLAKKEDSSSFHNITWEMSFPHSVLLDELMIYFKMISTEDKNRKDALLKEGDSKLTSSLGKLKSRLSEEESRNHLAGNLKYSVNVYSKKLKNKALFELPLKEFTAQVPQLNYTVEALKIIRNGEAIKIPLCEVKVFGDYVCPKGKFGLLCERTCNCHNSGESCIVPTGGCPSGCRTGYTGEDCWSRTAIPEKASTLESISKTTVTSAEKKTCLNGTFEASFESNCSSQCAGEEKACYPDTGNCTEGCELGYQPPLCTTACLNGTFGASCAFKCSSQCAGEEKACYPDTGNCTEGCELGYQPPVCTTDLISKVFGTIDGIYKALATMKIPMAAMFLLCLLISCAFFGATFLCAPDSVKAKAEANKKRGTEVKADTAPVHDVKPSILSLGEKSSINTKDSVTARSIEHVTPSKESVPEVLLQEVVDAIDTVDEK